jgi:hypothetical protein
MDDAIEQHYERFGTTWVSPDGSHRRIYFSEGLLASLIGLRYLTYKTGNIVSASLHGQKLSNRKADAIRTTLRAGKAYFDCVTQELRTEQLGQYTEAILRGLRQLGAC